MSRTLSRFLVGAVALLLLTASLPAQVLEKLPANPMVVARVPHLQQTSTGISNFAQQLGVALLVPQLADPLGALQEEIGIKAGINRESDMAMAFYDPGQGGPENGFVMLLPVTDYQAFIGNFENPQKEGNLDVVQFAKGGKAYVSKSGNYAMLSPGKAIFDRKDLGVKIAGAASKIMTGTGRDIMIYVDGKAVREKALPELQANRQQMIDGLRNELTNNQDPQAQKFQPVIVALVEQVLNFAEQALQGGRGAVFSLSINKDGLGTSLLADFDPQSSLGKTVSGMKNTSESLMAGLPAGDYVMFGGAVQDPKVIASFLQTQLDPIRKAAGDMEEGGKTIQDAIDLAMTNIKAIQSASMGFMVTPPTPETGMLKGVAVIKGDSKTMMDNLAKGQEVNQQLMKLMGQANAADVKVTPGATTVDGVKFDEIVTQVNLPAANDPQSQMAEQMIKSLYGPNGLKVLVGAPDPQSVVEVFGGDPQLLQAAVKSAKGNVSAIDKRPEVQAVNAKLPKNRLAVMYFAVDKAMTAVAKTMNAKVVLPPNLQPIGMAIATEGSAITIDSYIPADTLQKAFQAGMQMFQAQANPGTEPAGRPGDL